MIGVIKGDTRSLDYSDICLGLGFRVFGPVVEQNASQPDHHDKKSG